MLYIVGSYKSTTHKGEKMSYYIPTWNPPDPPQEAVQTECPYCHGNDTEFLGYADEARNTEKYVCHECEVDFTVEVEIPF